MNTSHYYKLPAGLAADIDAYQEAAERFLAGDLPAGMFKAKRVPCGVYEQRQDNVYMVRIRVAAGTLETEQIREMAALATEFGNAMLHVTTRQDIQLHGVGIKDTPEIMRRLMNVGLTTKGGGGNTVRNVTTCPYAGVCPHECFDVTTFSHAVTEYLIPLVGSYNLPRKYKIAFSGCAADCALAQVNDLGFIARMSGGKPGFRVIAAGGMGANSSIGKELFDWVPVSQVIRIAEAVRRLFDKHGDRSDKHRARLRFVFERLGKQSFLEQANRMLAAVADEGVPEWQGECSLNNTPVEPDADAPALTVSKNIRYLPQRQKDLASVPLHLPLGFVTARDFAEIGEITQKFSTEKGPRTTRSQNLLIRFVPKHQLDALGEELQQIETDILTPVPLSRFVACAGASTCRLGLCLARDAARASAAEMAAAKLEQQTIDALNVFINGCPNACGHQPVAPIGFFGAAKRFDGRLAPCYQVSFGGQCNVNGARLGIPASTIPAKAMPALLVDVARDFQTGRQADESFQNYCQRMGQKHFKTIAERYTNMPAYSEHPEFYRDFGAEEDFSLAGRGAGECGAGVFEIIQDELNAAGKAEQPADLILHTARALLITRGIDTQDTDTLLREFEAKFIDTKLVPDKFRPLVARARGFAQGWKQAFDGLENAAQELLEHAGKLYATLDANLEFHLADSSEKSQDDSNAGAGQTAAVPPETSRELDLGGVPCPLNFVKAKLQLETMDVGESLSIILDDGEPIRNVPASFRNEGQAVDEPIPVDDQRWRVVVRKTK